MKLAQTAAVIVAISLGGTSELFGNDEHPIVSTKSGGTPFLVVTTGSGASSREPGVYRRSADAGWELLFPGKVLLDPKSGSVLAQLESAQMSGRFETAIIIDGKIRFFSVQSDPSKPDTYFDIGGSGHGAMDIVGRRNLTIPPIEAFQDAAIYTREAETPDGNAVDLVLISVRAPQFPIRGVTGLSFGLAIERKNLQGDELKISNPPVLLSTEYLGDPMSVYHLFSRVEGEPGFISIDLLHSLARERPKDSRTLKEWRIDLLAYLRDELPNKFLRHKSELPYVSALTGEVIIGDLPSASLSFSGYEGTQVYNPITGESKLIQSDRRGRKGTSLEEFSAVKPILPGEVEFDKLESMSAINLEFAHTINFVKTREGRFFLTGKSTGSDGTSLISSLEIFPTQVLEGEITDFAAYALKDQNLLFTSWKTDKGKKLTCVHEVQVSKFPYRILREIVIAEEYFDIQQLKWRASEYTVEDLEVGRERIKAKVVGFDLETPVSVESAEAYGAQHRATSPHIDIEASLKKGSKREELQVFFPEPVRNIELADGLTYIEYDNGASGGLGLKRTGFIYKHQGEKDSTAFVGGILTAPGQLNLESDTLFDQPISVPISDDKTRTIRVIGVAANAAPGVVGAGQVHLFVIDPEHRGSIAFYTEILSSIMSLHSEVRAYPGAAPSRFKLFASLPGHRIPLESLRSIGILKVIRPDSQHKRPGVILGSATIEGAGSIVFEVPFEFKENKVRSAGSTRSVLVSSDLLTADEILSRLRYDHKDRLVFISTPELDPTDGKFECLVFDTQKPHRVGQTGPIALKSLDIKAKPGEYVDPGSWRVTDFGAMKDEERALRDRLRNAAEYSYDVFQVFRDLLNDAANPQVKPQHLFVIVPPSVKKYLSDYPMALWLRKENTEGLMWNHADKNFRFMALPSQNPGAALDQADVFENFDAMRQAARQGRRVAIMSTIERLKSLGTPKAPDKAEEELSKYPKFLLKDEAVQSVSIAGMSESESRVEASEIAPSLLYLLETEGRPTPVQKLMKDEPDYQIPIILVGTKAEYESLENPGIEAKYGVRSRFRVVELEPPTADLRARLILENVFGLPVIQSLGYEVDLSTFTRSGASDGESSYAHVARYIVNRAEPLAVDNGMDIFESLLKVMNRLGVELSSNPEIRTERKITRAFIERTMAKVFPMPLSVDNLPPNDPYQILSQKDFIRRWNQTGFHGQFPIKSRMKDILLSPLLPSDGKNVPGSFMLFGEHGLGKTTLVDSLFLGVLKMKPYRIGGTPEENRGACYLRLNLQEVIDPKTMSAEAVDRSSAGASTSLSLEKALAAFDGVLLTSQGRAAIILDDVHRATDNVRGIFLSRIRSLQDNRSYQVKDAGGRYHEYPTRNLWPGLIFNFTDSRERIKKFAKYEWQPTEEEWILATLSSDLQPIDRSSLARFGTRINYSGYTPDAKGPKLREEILKIAKSNLISSQFLQIVSPEVTQRVINTFPRLNARDFSAAVARGLSSLKPTTGGQACSIVVPRNFSEASAAAATRIFGGEEGIAVEKYILENFQSIPIFGKDLRGQVGLMQYFIDNFRNRAFYISLDAIMNEPLMQSEPHFQRYMLVPLAHSIQRHISLFQDPAMSQLLNVEGRWLGANTDAMSAAIREELRAIELRAQAAFPERPAFPKVVLANAGGGDLFDEGLSIPFSETEARVMVATQNKLQEVFEDLAFWLLRMDPKQNLDEWLSSLQKGKPQLPTNLVSIKARLAKIFEEYTEGLSRAKTAGGEPKTIYDLSRFYVVLIDQALHRLNWGQLTNLGSALLDRATADLAFSQSPEIQKILFESGEREDRWSLFVPLDANTLVGFVENIPLVQESRSSEGAQHERFKRNCSGWIADLGQQN